MQHFKISLETGKNLSESRVLFVRTDDIIGALNISKKIRDSHLSNIIPVSYEDYMKGVSKKYDETKAKKVQIH